MATHAKTTRQRKAEQRRAAAARSRLITLISVGLIAVGLLIVLLTSKPTVSDGTAPNFSAQTVDGKTVSLADHRGEVVMLNFWATWCPPCKAEMPVLQNAYERHKDDGFTIIGVNNMEKLSTVQRFVQSARLSFPIAMDEHGVVQRTFGIMGYPTSIFVGPNGKIYATHSGALRADQLEQYIAQGLAMR